MADINFNSLKQTLTQKMAEVNVKTTEFLEVTKIKNQISTANQEIERIEKRLGQQCYLLWEEGKLQETELQELLEAIWKQRMAIRECENHIQEIEEKNRELLRKPESGRVFCSSCGAENIADAVFCRSCGKRMN